MKRYDFTFDCMGNIEEIEFPRQIEKIIEEVTEVKQAHEDGDLPAIACETMDVIHACETLLRMMPIDIVNLAMNYVRANNEARGYYSVSQCSPKAAR